MDAAPLPRPARTGRLTDDPRLYQIFALVSMLAYGLARLDFALHAGLFAVYVASALGTQALAVWVLRRWRPATAPRFEWKSALITSLSLSLLLRVGAPWLAALAGAVAIGGKFLIRWRGKHVFNPSLLGILVLLALPGSAWVSPGQWGREGLLLFVVCLTGGLVLFRALRSDITFAFLGAYAGLILARGLYLGDPPPIMLHQLSSGALLIFAFFMISDPRSTPDAQAGRVLFAAAVAATAYYFQFELYNPHGLLWALGLWSMAVPLIDFLLPARRFEWTTVQIDAGRTSLLEPSHEHESITPPRSAGGPAADRRPVYGGL